MVYCNYFFVLFTNNGILIFEKKNLEKVGFKPVLGNHTKENFCLNREFMRKSQPLARRHSNQISRFRIEAFMDN